MKNQYCYLQSFMKINTWKKCLNFSSRKFVASEIYYIPSFKYAESNPSHAFAGDRKIYLHDRDVFTLDICILDILSRWTNRSNDLFSAFRQYP